MSFDFTLMYYYPRRRSRM